jgi:hypothetical protein
MVLRRLISFAGLVCFTAFAGFAATNGILELNLRVNDLAVDPGTERLYATSPDHPNDLLRLDPVTGAIAETFPVGRNPHKLVVDMRRGLWIGLNGEGMVRRFNLDTTIPETKYDLKAGSTAAIFDIAPSPNDSDTFAVNAAGRTYLFRDGVLLPDSIQQVSYLVMIGNYVFSYAARLRATPTGLVADGAGAATGIGNTEVLGERIYYIGGSVDPFTFGTTVSYIPPLAIAGDPWAHNFAFAVDAERYVLWSHFNQRFHLTRFDRETGAVTGYTPLDIPAPVFWTFPIALIGTNRVAVATSEKLYLLDLNTLFVPGDLEVSVSSEPNPATFARSVTQTISIANSGPGYVVNAAITNHLSGEAHFLGDSQTADWMAWDRREFHWNFTAIAPGETRVVQTRVLPVKPGLVTNLITSVSNLETNLQNNTVESVVPVLNPLSNIVARIAPFTNVTALAYDSVADELLLGDARGNLSHIGLDDPELRRHNPFGLSYAVEYLSISPATRTAWAGVGGWNSVYRIPLDTDDISPEYRNGLVLRDLEASPVDPQFVALSDSSRVRTFGPSSFFQNGAGVIEFSADGKTLYQLLDLDCSLRVMNVTATNLNVARSYPNMPCYDFVESGGRLYFYNGVVLDPANGTTITNLNLPYPSFIVPDPSGPLNVLTHEDNVWLVRRLDRGTFAELGTIHLGTQFSPTVAISAGTNRIAFHDASGEAILVRFDANVSTTPLKILRTSSSVTIQFATEAGARYRLEQSPSIVSPAWRPTGEEITGTGLITERTVAASNQSSFYRLARLL